MKLNAKITPQKFPRAFACWTYVQFQVRGGNTINISKEQGEAADPNDGLQLTLASTNPPWATWIKGDLWYTSNIDNSTLIIEIQGTADANFHP